MLMLDRRKPLFPGIHSGAYPLGLIGAYIIGETANGAPAAPRFFDSVTTQFVIINGSGTGLHLKNLLNCGGLVDYNDNGSYSLQKATRAYDPKTWFIRGCCRASAAGGLIAKNDNNTVSDGWMHSIDSTLGVDFRIEFSVTSNLIVRAAPAGQGPWADCIHSLGFRWDGTGTAANQLIQIDGIKRAHTIDTNGGGVHTSDGTHPLIVDSSVTGDAFGGTTAVESFFFFNRPLSPVELQELFIYPYRYYVPQMDVMLKSGANQFTQALNASMATFSGSLTRQTNKNLTASMSTFSAILGLAHHLFLVALPAAMQQMAGTLIKQAGKALNASMSTFAAVLGVVKIKSGNAVALNASMATMAGALVRQDNKVFNAGMSRFSATLALAVRHGVPPPTCIPAGCTTIPTIISHVEQCDEQGS